MYSHEVEQLLKIRNYLIAYKEFIQITKSSPQINHIKYNPFEDNIEMWTTDNYSFKLKINKKSQ
jgi:hypothetical protein